MIFFNIAFEEGFITMKQERLVMPTRCIIKLCNYMIIQHFVFSKIFYTIDCFQNLITFYVTIRKINKECTFLAFQ